MNIRLLGQVVLQVIGLKYATVKYRKKDTDNYVSKAEYNTVDTRPLPEKDIKDGYIHRGLLVKNFGNE